MEQRLQKTRKQGIALCLVRVLIILQLYMPNVSANSSSNPLTLNYTKQMLESGKTLKLKVKSRSYKLPEENYCYWESSDTNIATVDEKGTVTALSPGTVTITYTENTAYDYGDWWGYFYDTLGTATCKITVTKGKYFLKKNELTMVSGDVNTVQLPDCASIEYTTQTDYTEWPYGYVSVSKEDSTLTITAYDAGTVFVYVNFYSAKGKFVSADRLKITVLRRGIDVEELTCAVGKKHQFEVNGYTKDQIISWESSNPEIATINSSGKLTAVNEGETVITLGVQTKDIREEESTDLQQTNSSTSSTMEPNMNESTDGYDTDDSSEWDDSEDSWNDDDDNDWDDDWDDDWDEDDSWEESDSWYDEEEDWYEDTDDGIEYYECQVYITNPKLVAKSQNLAMGYSDTIELKGISTYSTIEAKSSKEAVVSVSENQISANAKGTAVITLTVDGVKLNYTVRVTDPQINVPLVPIAVGKFSTIKVSGTNSYSEIKFKTSDKNIVAVNQEGLIKGKKEGVATITAIVDGKEIEVPISVGNSKVVTMLNYGINAIGSAYSQAYRMSDKYYDCSSLAWRSYHAANINFGNNSWAPTAASIAEYCVKNKLAIAYKALDASELQPGDLLFFSRGENGRYKNIYHVAIYAGAYVSSYTYGEETTTYTEGLLLEARDEGVGLFHYDPYARNVVVVARPTK